MINPTYLPEQYSIKKLADGRIEIALDPDKYKDLGGKGSPQLEAFLHMAVEEKRACSHGVTLSEPQPVWGYVSIIGQCN